MSGRCASCNAKMSTYDMKRKHAVTGEYFDLCGKCLQDVLEIVDLPILGDRTFIQEKEEDSDESQT